MATTIDSAPRNQLGSDREDIMGARTIPIINQPPPPIIKTTAPPDAGDPMDITTPTKESAPRGSTKSPGDEGGKDSADRQQTNGFGGGSGSNEQSSNTNNSASNSMPAPTVAAAAVHQPKIVQTAFIHKLYNMLEDPNIQHLISWSNSAESFVMSPSHDFSKVLAQYFKHTNISSFVRQLNMYGFHKVSDVFHTGSPETALWEFKHGNGNFKRGDLVGLREIKRRASRHALVHREYNNQKPTPSQPGTPAEPMPPIPDGVDPRMAHMEHTLFDVNTRLQRSEEAAAYMHIKQQAMMDTVNRLLQFNQELSRTILALVPNPSEQIHRDIVALQGEMQQLHSSNLRQMEPESHGPEPSSLPSRGYLANLENPPVSPRQLAQDSRLNVPQARGANFYRPPVPSNLSIGSSRRPYGSISGGTTAQSSPSPLRQQAPAPAAPAPPHPLSNVIEAPPGSLARRHTSADIRAHGWQAAPSPFGASGPPSSQWPSSPSRAPPEERLRDSLHAYSLQNAAAQSHSRPNSPPAPPFSNGISTMDSFNNWSWGSASRENKNLSIRDHSGPPTRRGSMAHILNPTDTAERDDEDDPRGDEDRKRKRLQ